MHHALGQNKARDYVKRRSVYYEHGAMRNFHDGKGGR